LLLALGQADIREDGELDRTSAMRDGADDPGPDIELFGRDAQRLGDLLENFCRGPAQTTFDLALVGVADADLLAELPQGQPRRESLLPVEVSE
jgi:hypothetical protein